MTEISNRKLRRKESIGVKVFSLPKLIKSVTTYLTTKPMQQLQNYKCQQTYIY